MWGLMVILSCWNGKDLDSPNHQSHVAYSGTGAAGGGACPSSHPVKLPQVMFELMWNLTSFQKDRSNWATDSPLVYSMGLGYVPEAQEICRKSLLMFVLVAQQPTVTTSLDGKITPFKKLWTITAKVIRTVLQVASITSPRAHTILVRLRRHLQNRLMDVRKHIP
jgi:hypothetical protein